MVITLFTGALNDDTISISKDKKALLECATYATEWSNNIYRELFPDLQSAVRYYKSKFPDRVLEQARIWLEDDNVDDYPYTPEEYWTDMVYEQGAEL